MVRPNLQPTNIKFEYKSILELEKRSMFVWQGRMYTVEGYDEEDQRTICREVAAGWTQNPDDRWMFGVAESTTPFASCNVHALMYERSTA